MYLKRLELLGFKSFPDKTVIKLTGGVTAIVGPNGCGKTNILDSIRWVLGEQRVSLLRGAKMEEVIFNGTRDIKPLGMAEVTLVIQNNKGVLPTEYSEVQITRRLFRSGESEYLLNKVPCRLKDIADLLMDTGIGAHIYSVIQQDMIDAILSDRTDDRRFLFEEAAGISKYKNRKKAALRKLEATEQDLLRLKDIVAEVSMQVGSLGRQMRKAERYQKMTEELKDWEIFLGRTSLDHMREERRSLLIKREQLLDIRVKCDTEIDSLSARQEETRRELVELDHQLTALGNAIYEKSEEAHTKETEIGILRGKRENLQQMISRNRVDIEAFERRKELLAEQIESGQHEIETIDSDLQNAGAELERLETLLADSDNRMLQARKGRDALQQELRSLEGRISAGQSNDSNLREQEGEINASLSESATSATDLLERVDAARTQKIALENAHFRISEILVAHRQKQSTLEKEIADLNARADELSGEIFELSASLEAAEARRHLLSEMIAHYEGYGAGVVATFENRQNWPGLLGTLADSLTPHAGYEEAIAAALGESAGFMLCRDRATAEDVISHLRREQKGKAGLIILEECGISHPTVRPEFPEENIIGWADQFISCAEEYAPLAKLLLSRTLVVKADFDRALLNSLPLFFNAVTLEGGRFESRAVISGGSSDSVSLFGRREKVAAQENIIIDLSSRLENLKMERSRATALIASKKAEIRETASSGDTLKAEADRIEKEITGCEFHRQSLDNDLQRLERERRNFSVKLELLRSRQYDLSLNYDQLARERNELTARLGNYDSEIESLEKSTDEIQNQFSAAQIRQIELRSNKQQLEAQIRHTGELIVELENSRVSKNEEITDGESELGQSAETLARRERELKELFDARAELTGSQSARRETQASIMELQANFEKDIKQRRLEREEALSQWHAAELRMTELDAESRNLIDKIRNEYGIDLESESALPPDPGLPEESRPQRLAELREMIRNYGAVNLLALEEYRTAKERQEFLSAQMSDLLNAKSTLQTTISKINVTAKNLFHETFQKVRENFRKVFEELFTGGEADIRLTDEADPLESPIEIIARPRGKKLLSIAQMSGGERALTAISLLFAIYLVKPSPFCILDEIDAPLDDANIHRFLRMIKAFSDQTQFIIITHNKITMEAADVLYGVTMEQPGISRVVSVRFNEEGEENLINTSLMDERYTPSPEREKITEEILANLQAEDKGGNISDREG